MEGRDAWKNEGWERVMGKLGGNIPTFTSLVNR